MKSTHIELPVVARLTPTNLLSGLCGALILTVGAGRAFAGPPTPPPIGSLQVTIIPAGAISAGAQWQVDGGVLQASGMTVLGLSVGSHTVNFSPVSGWTTPANETVSVSANSTITATGLYLENVVTAGMALVPAGSFTMGDTLDGASDSIPMTVTVSAFYMDGSLVSYGEWQTIYSFATSQGFCFDNAGSGKGPNYPVETLNWYDTVKWCNARSQQAGLTPVYYTDAALTQVYTTGQLPNPYVNWGASGYRLPTEAEWEKAARGGLIGQRFPWGDTISESQANYYGEITPGLDLGPNGFNSVGEIGGYPYETPTGYFAPNGFSLYDMAGNVWEWCWDWYGVPYSGGTDPQGPGSGDSRVLRGGSFQNFAGTEACASRGQSYPVNANIDYGFRCVTMGNETMAAPTIACPTNVQQNQDTGQCQALVSFPTPIVTGYPTPTVTCSLNGTPITSPFEFPVGVSTVECVATNDQGTNTCEFTVTVIDTNPPVAGAAALTTLQGQSAAVPVAKLLLKDKSPSGGALSVTGVTSPTVGGATVTLANGEISYAPPGPLIGYDAINYTLSDGCGTTQGAISVTVQPNTLPTLNTVSATITPQGVVLVFAGIPGAAYRIQEASVISGPWINLSGVLNAADNGLVEYTDTTQPQPATRFYRTQYISGP